MSLGAMENAADEMVQLLEMCVSDVSELGCMTGDPHVITACLHELQVPVCLSVCLSVRLSTDDFVECILSRQHVTRQTSCELLSLKFVNITAAVCLCGQCLRVCVVCVCMSVWFV